MNEDTPRLWCYWQKQKQIQKQNKKKKIAALDSFHSRSVETNQILHRTGKCWCKDFLLISNYLQSQQSQKETTSLYNTTPFPCCTLNTVQIWLEDKNWSRINDGTVGRFTAWPDGPLMLGALHKENIPNKCLFFSIQVNKKFWR